MHVKTVFVIPHLLVPSEIIDVSEINRIFIMNNVWSIKGNEGYKILICVFLDFFDDGTAAPSQTPDSNAKEVPKLKSAEDLPEGFFDDLKMDAKVSLWWMTQPFKFLILRWNQCIWKVVLFYRN